MKELMLGNKALARGLYEAGCCYISAYPGTPSTEVTEEAAAEIGEYLAGGRKKFEVPYLQEGTSFRLDVWHALSEIPYGKTVTYTELAAAAGHPKAVRAAGSACAENRIPIIVPCHRVVPSAGGVGSYVGGSELKSRLLAIEKEQS